jgi:hypothetical protein
MVEADNVFFGFCAAEWNEISEALTKLTDNAAYHGCAKTMASYVTSRKKPSDKQARILAKGLLLLKAKGKCTQLLAQIDGNYWKLLAEIGGAPRSS